MPRRSSLASLYGGSSEGSVESTSHEDIASPVDCPSKRERRKAIFDGEVSRSCPQAGSTHGLGRVGLGWVEIFGPIPWGHSGPLCHALSLLSSSSSWTSMRRRRATVATPDEWQCKTARSDEWAQLFFKSFLFFIIFVGWVGPKPLFIRILPLLCLRIVAWPWGNPNRQTTLMSSWTMALRNSPAKRPRRTSAFAVARCEMCGKRR